MGVAAVRRRKPRIPALALVHAPAATETVALAVLGRGAFVHEVAWSLDSSVSAGGIPRSLAPLAAASLARSVRPCIQSALKRRTRTNAHTAQGNHTNTQKRRTRTNTRAYVHAYAPTKHNAIIQPTRTHARTDARKRPVVMLAARAVMAWALPVQPWSVLSAHGTDCAWSATTSIHRGCSTARSCTVQSGYGPTGAHSH